MTTDQKMLVDLPITWTPDKGDRGSVIESRSSMGSEGSIGNVRSPHVAGWI
jgi:hypothetical protein